MPYARRVLGSIDELIVAAHNDALFEGVMRLGVTEMIANTWLGVFLKALKERFPNVLAELTVDLSENLSSALFNRSLDLALQSGPFDRQVTGLVDLGSYPLIWVASPELGIPADVARCRRASRCDTRARNASIRAARRSRGGGQGRSRAPRALEQHGGVPADDHRRHRHCLHARGHGQEGDRQRTARATPVPLDARPAELLGSV